ncbi:G2/mitotic-specific cyclin [Serendipita sp. 396]|nr:G2/mitotic-specific cyclin [Serendipita sp. 396]KAG8782973.1 G2/mitotic-specific cyclin [Serendipita sp. 397]KAG8798336.1 G2/mitotic-specific cyclin [Serendipita sp. 398]KAG8821355.1 G2/mitotic-specific cyclin [Serendipita sp. 401]KAG8828187.1 G2/mitotic-specific cyclin [Serendipita sp. 400]KAG8867190.1 G2/mitotic-specific cyclin [Serendipita sp. 405]KAG9054559.1 G2/mitotic-specific cyclin [Serendipita sp. 407]
MSTQIPTRRPTRVTRPGNDENAPTKLSGLARAKSAISTENNIKAAPPKDSANLKPTLRTKTALVQQQENTNTSSVAGKRKRDALGDATNGKGKLTVAVSKPSVPLNAAVRPSSSAAHQRASSISTAPSKENATRARAPLGIKPKNTSTTSVVVNEKPKKADAPSDGTVSSTATGRIIRRPGSVKPARPAATTSTTTVSRKVTQTTVREETKKKVGGHEQRVEKVSKTTTVEEEVKLKELDVDEEELRSHKRPRLSDEVDAGLPVADFKGVSVEKVSTVLKQVTAKPEDESWDDLDKEDEGDPLMVSEYVVEIFDYLKALEKTTMPNAKFMDYQKALKPHMRGILGEWIIGIHRAYRMVPETLFICMNLIDRFLSIRAISLEKVQLVGVVCLLLASKYEEISAPSISTMLNFSSKSSSVEEIKEAEKYVLKSLKYNLSYTSPITFLRRVSKADNFDVESRTLAKYLVEIYCVEYELIQFTPSCIAAAAMWLARLALDRGEWSANLAHYAGYKEAELLPAANVMLNYVLKHPQHASLFEKYASRKFNKASVYMRSWALGRWNEGDDVDLESCLEALMEDSKLRVLSGNAGVVTLIEPPVFNT